MALLIINRLIHGDRVAVATKEMHGSNIRYANKHGYQVFSERRVAGGERNVDDTIHVQIRNLLNSQHNGRQALVLVTGDGNNNNGKDNFPNVCWLFHL